MDDELDNQLQGHHYAVDESLTPGEYDASCFDEPVWQYKVMGIWQNNDGEPQSENKRQFMPVKKQIPTCEDKGTFCMDKYKEYCKVCLKYEQPESPKFGEWVDVLSECKRVQNKYRKCKQGTNGAGIYNGLEFAIVLIQKLLLNA